MKEHNKEIIETLLNCKTGFCCGTIKYSEDIKKTTYNGNLCRILLQEWDVSDAFPEESIKACIRMGEWLPDDFSIRNELNIKRVLPPYMIKVFFFMKDFSDKKDQSLNSTIATYIKMMGLPSDSPDSLGYAVYEYAILKYKE